MKRKSIGWITLTACVMAVAIVVIGGRTTTPRSARAASSTWRWNPMSGTTQACQAVIDQMIAMRQAAIDKKRSGKVKPLAADDQMVAQEYQLDMKKCPEDFQLTLFRFMITEDTARLHAHTDPTGNSEKILGAIIESVATHGFSARESFQITIDSDEKTADRQKKDLEKMQTALLDVEHVAKKYGAK
jgi:hypothetical protein